MEAPGNGLLIILCFPSKILRKYCLNFLLGLTTVPRETGNNAYAEFWRDKQSIMVFLNRANGLSNQQPNDVI